MLSHYIPAEVSEGNVQNAASSHADSPSVIWDKDALLQRIGNDRAQLTKLLDMYLDNASTNFEKLALAIQQKDWSNATNVAHTLKGTAGNIHALHFQGTIAVLELELDAGREDIQSHFQSVTEAWHTLKHAIKEYLQQNNN